MGSSKRWICLLLLCLAGTSLATFEKNGTTMYKVFTDGIYDLTHYGHLRAIQKARETAVQHLNVTDEQIYLVVGISGLSEAQRKRYKRAPIMTRDEIKNTLVLIKGVDKVIFSPLHTTSKVMNRQKYDLVVAGTDYTPPPYNLRSSAETNKGLKYYPGPIHAGKFATFPREPDVSTTEIIRRTVSRVAEHIEEKMKEDGEEERCIQVFLEKMNKYLPAPAG